MLDRLRGLRAKELLAQDPRNLDDVQRFIRQRLQAPNLAERLTRARCSLEDVSCILREKSEGNFLYIVQALDGIERELYYIDQLDALPPGLYGLYKSFFERHFPDEGSYRDIRRLLEVVVAAREPLTESQLSAATGLDRRRQLPGVLRRLAVYVPWRVGEDEIPCYALYHKSLGDWLTDPDLTGTLHSVVGEDGHHRLAETCWGEFERGPKSMSPYAVAHLPAHLLELALCTQEPKEKLDWWWKLAELVASSKLGLVDQWVERGDAFGLECLEHLIDKDKFDRVHQASLSAQAARIYSRYGKHFEAKCLLEKALQYTSWWRGRRTRAVALHEMGSVYLGRGEPQQAAREYRRALRLCVWGVPVFHDEAAANRIALATIAFDKYQWRRVVRLARRAHRQAQAADDPRHAIAANRLIGLAFDELGRYQEAESELQAALELSQRTDAALETARLLNVKGDFYYAQATLRGECYERAAECFRQTMEVAESICNLYSGVDAKLKLGWCAVGDGNAGEAVECFEQAGASLPTEAYPELQLWIRLGMAATLHQSGSLENAALQYQDVLTVAERRDFRGIAARALVGLGAIHWHSGRHEQANTDWVEARRIAKSNSPRDQQLTEANIRLCRSNPCVTPR
ncbi:MAG: tetratricopeptide repeat protein [Planctomycetes bacterium]|nr:tetratricopeptide repeat protein [Planctomycetota bacterium]